MNRTTTENAILIVALLGVMVPGQAMAVGCGYIGSGDYNDLYSVTHVNGWNPDGTGPGGLPGLLDTIRINDNNNTVTLTNVAPDVANFQFGVDESGQLVVESGGKLSAVSGTAASAVGYNGYANGVYGRLTVKTNGEVSCFYYLRVGHTGFGVVTLDGGTLNCKHHLWVGGGINGNGTIILTNGGTLNMTGANGNNGMIGIGSNNGTSASGGWGYVYVRGGGVLNLYAIDPNGGSIQPGSVLDISGSGVVTIPGDMTSVMTNKYTTTGKITAYGGTGTVAVDYNVSNPGKTTLTAVGGYVAPTDCTWDPASNPYSTGLWGENANWTCGRPPVGVTVAIFNKGGVCTVNDSVVADSIDMGTNGPGGTLIITNTGILACVGTNANFIGNNSNALMVVENGATVSFGSQLRLGFDSGADGRLLMNGGTVSVSGMFDLGYQGGKGTAQIKGGTLNLAAFDDVASMGGPSMAGTALLDITGTGTVILNGNHQTAMEYYISSGQITNSSGGTVLVDYNVIHTGKTTLYPSSLVLAPEQVVWNPAANPPGTGLWEECINWTGGLCPGNVTVVTFNVTGAIPCTVTNAAFARYVVMGDSGRPGGTLIITNGGSLTTGNDNWTAVAYSSNALMVVGSGASASFGSHLWIGFNVGADGTLIIDGGTVSVGGMIGLGWGGGKGTVIVTNGGSLNLAQWHDTQSIMGDSVLDIGGTSTVLISGNHVTSISNYVANGKIIANGGTGKVAYGFDSGANQTIVQVAPPRQSVTSATVSGGNMTVSFQTTAGHFYHIESTASLSPAVWTPVAGSSTNAVGASVTFSFPAGSAPVIYRTVSP